MEPSTAFSFDTWTGQLPRTVATASCGRKIYEVWENPEGEDPQILIVGDACFAR